MKSSPPPIDPNAPPRVLAKPVFGQPEATPDPTTFVVKHPSDGPIYKEIDQLNKEHKLAPLPFDPPRGGVEPVLTLQAVFGGDAAATAAVKRITNSGQIVFHSTGDCGSTKGPRTQDEVTDKMVADFQEQQPQEIPQFHFLLGDIVYSFGEVQYYYDQFYEPYRNYPAPILAAEGNHDGMVAPQTHAKSLAAYMRNFCSDGFKVLPEAGGLSRTAQIQPGVFFTFEAPFIRILTLYSNTLEDPGVIADGTGAKTKLVGNSQLDYLEAALTRVKTQKFAGALLIAHHHPPYSYGSRHNWSTTMQAQIDAVCEKVGVWPHADLAGHAHNYQRFTRTRSDGTQIPYIVCGNGGHNVQKLQAQGGSVIRAPQVLQAKSATTDQIVFENYDDSDYGYLRIVVTATQLRIEYHPASDGASTKAPNDFTTVDLKSRTIVHYTAPDLGLPQAARAVKRKVTT